MQSCAYHLRWIVFELWGFLDFSFDNFCRFAIELTSRQEVRFRQTFFQNEVKKVLYEMVLVSEIVKHIGRIYSPLNLANMKSQKLKFIRNTAPRADNAKGFNF